jgi:tRNA pseudouridine32 synthase/23S rRNA pseudouridine746 synthase
VLPFLLGGLAVAPRRRWRPRAGAGAEVLTLHEDPRVVAVLKPPGLLSAPARDLAVTESLWAWLRARYPAATGPLLVHRLDLDTSGVVLAALDLDAYRWLQAQFIARTVEKRYLAWLEGLLPASGGRIDLPLRVDLEQRPRQLVDPVHGRPAVTDWEALEERGGRTRVRFSPRTGRTHQLRVHAAHAQGLGTPIVGDRLYGQAGDRLLLHAETVVFSHPDGTTRTITAPAPF